MDDGVMAWNEQGLLQFLNVQAARLLHLDAQASQWKISIWRSSGAAGAAPSKHARGLNHVEVTLKAASVCRRGITFKPIVEARKATVLFCWRSGEQDAGS
jgi:transcriptional activator for dhaKLM operon